MEALKDSHHHRRLILLSMFLPHHVFPLGLAVNIDADDIALCHDFIPINQVEQNDGWFLVD